MDFLFSLPLLRKTAKILKIKKNFSLFSKILKFSQNEIQTYQFKQLKKLVEHAFQNVPLYREKWTDAGLSPDDLTTLEDLNKFPLITKDDFRKGYPEKTVAHGYKYRKNYQVGTSGSTGSSIKMLYSRDKTFFEIAAMSLYSVNMHLDYNLKTYLTFFVENDQSMEILASREFKTKHYFQYNALEPPEKQIRELGRIQPDCLATYPSVLKNISIYAQEHNLELYQPSLILASGETLDDHTKSLIKRTFHCDLLEAYISTEGGIMAVECSKHKGMHLFPGKLLVQFADDQGNNLPDGEYGNIVITDLINYATPVIRYAGMGDISAFKKEECSCKMKYFPLIERIAGRRTDTVVLPGRKLIHPLSLTRVMDHKPGVARFQIRQEKIDELKVLIVKEHTEETKDLTFTEGCKIYTQIKKEFREIVGDEMTVKIEVVDHIPHKTGTHKSQLVYSPFHK